MDEDQKVKLKAIILVAVLLFPVLIWAPWMSDKEIHDWIVKDKARIDGTVDINSGELVCDYTVSWAPFGRWVASCEGAYYVTFFGVII